MEARIIDTDKLREIIEQIEQKTVIYNKLKSEFKRIRDQRKSLLTSVEEEINMMVELERRIKELRRELREKKNSLMRIIEKKKKLRERVRELNDIIKGRPNLPKPPHELYNELRRLETVYETSNLNRRQEKRIVEKINSLTIMLKRYEESEKAKKEKNKILDELDELDPEPFMKRLDEIKGEITTLKRELDEKREKAAKLNKEKMKIEREFQSVLLQLKPLEEELRNLRKERDRLLEPHGIKAGNMSFDEIMKILNNQDLTLKKALQKLSKGESLTFDEFSVLVKHGLI